MATLNVSWCATREDLPSHGADGFLSYLDMSPSYRDPAPQSMECDG